MAVKIPQAGAMSVHHGEFVYFCNAACKNKFDAAPGEFIQTRMEIAGKKKPPHPTPGKGLKKVELPITGISCASCVARIEKGLSKMSGIVNAKVNFATEKATITFDLRGVVTAIALSRALLEILNKTYSGPLPIILS